MRYPEGHKEQTRERLIEAAGRVLRERGYAGAGVDALAEEAGLTSGAFYGHFDSKEHLLTEVIRGAVKASEEIREAGLDHLEGRDWLAALLRRYMSAEHWQAIREGCPMPTLVSELPRAGDEARRAFAEGLDELIRRIESKLGDTSKARETAIASVAMAVGSMALARAVGDEALSKEILGSCRRLGVERMVDPSDEAKSAL